MKLGPLFGLLQLKYVDEAICKRKAIAQTIQRASKRRKRNNLFEDFRRCGTIIPIFLSLSMKKNMG
jgi:hypothetical protein